MYYLLLIKLCTIILFYKFNHFLKHIWQGNKLLTLLDILFLGHIAVYIQYI